jgi:hypothetical protein
LGRDERQNEIPDSKIHSKFKIQNSRVRSKYGIVDCGKLRLGYGLGVAGQDLGRFEVGIGTLFAGRD